MAPHRFALACLLCGTSLAVGCTEDPVTPNNPFPSTTTNSTGNVETGNGATTAGSTGTTSANTSSTATTGTGSMTTAGGATTSTGGSTGGTTSMVDSDAGPGPDDSGTTGGTGGTNGFPPCESGTLEPCGTHVLPDGTEIPLGPYGAQVEVNVGQAFAGADEGLSSAICSVFVSSFGADPEEGERLLDTEDLDFTLYTVYSPAHMPEGEIFPIVTWGNGTCAQPEGYGALLRYVASHGFVVVAANNRFIGSGVAQRSGIDFMFAANDDPDSPYYQKLDTTRVAAMGHSQGGMGTAAATRDDERIQTAILFNGGTSATRPFLALSGERDIGGDTVESFGSSVESNPPSAWLYYHKILGDGDLAGHLTLMTEPQRVTEATVAWLKYMLFDDAESRDFFVEPACTLCGHEEDFHYGSAGLQ